MFSGQSEIFVLHRCIALLYCTVSHHLGCGEAVVAGQYISDRFACVVWAYFVCLHFQHRKISNFFFFFKGCSYWAVYFRPVSSYSLLYFVRLHFQHRRVSK